MLQLNPGKWFADRGNFSRDAPSDTIICIYGYYQLHSFSMEDERKRLMNLTDREITGRSRGHKLTLSCRRFDEILISITLLLNKYCKVN